MSTSTVIDRHHGHVGTETNPSSPAPTASRRREDTAAPNLGPDGIASLPGLTTRQVAWRIFFTAWIVYSLHFATNIPRELFPALALGDHFSFRVDEYAHMHPDLFETPGRGWHIGNNPGVSMLAAIPYAIARPVIDPIVEKVKAAR